MNSAIAFKRWVERLTLGFWLVAGSVLATPLTVVNELDVALGDTGDTPSTASIIYGTGELDRIDGYITGDSRRVDMYGIWLSAGDLFAVRTEVTAGDPGELNVFLFDEQGRGIAAALLGQGGDLSNLIPSYTGLHYLAVAQIQTLYPYALVDPATNGQALIFTTNTTFGYHVPGGPTADLSVYSWGGTISGNFDAYSIFLRGASFVPTPIPQPASLALIALGMVAIRFIRRLEFEAESVPFDYCRARSLFGGQLAEP